MSVIATGDPADEDQHSLMVSRGRLARRCTLMAHFWARNAPLAYIATALQGRGL